MLLNLSLVAVTLVVGIACLGVCVRGVSMVFSVLLGVEGGVLDLHFYFRLSLPFGTYFVVGRLTNLLFNFCLILYLWWT
jgi:hypothetical protein